MRHDESIEDYLETILILSKKRPVVRSVDIANEMGFKKPSVSVAVKNMKAKEYIEVSEDGFITLTPSGKKRAKNVYERHTFFTKWFADLGIDEETADEDACSIEHVISDKTFKAIRNYVNKS